MDMCEKSSDLRPRRALLYCPSTCGQVCNLRVIVDRSTVCVKGPEVCTRYIVPSEVLSSEVVKRFNVGQYTYHTD